MVSFNTTPQAADGNNVGILVPDEIVESFGRGKRVLAVAFEKHPGTAAAWAALSYSKQKAHALSINEAKTETTRDRRVAKVLEALTN